MSLGWAIAYWCAALWVFGAACGWAWRKTAQEHGDFGGFAAVAFLAFGAGLLWPGVPVLYGLHRVLEWAKHKEDGARKSAR